MKVTKSLKFLVIVGLLASFLVSLAPSAASAWNVGGVDLSLYCRVNKFDGKTWLGAMNLTGNVNGWVCYRYVGSYRYYTEINVTNACRQQYPQYGSAVHSHWTTYSNPYSWYCDVH